MQIICQSFADNTKISAQIVSVSTNVAKQRIDLKTANGDILYGRLLEDVPEKDFVEKANLLTARMFNYEKINISAEKREDIFLFQWEAK